MHIFMFKMLLLYCLNLYKLTFNPNESLCLCTCYFSCTFNEINKFHKAIVLCPGLCPRANHIFIIYYSPQQIIQKHLDIRFHFYADDTKLCLHLTHKNVSL